MFNVHIQGKLLLAHACHVQVLVPLSGTGKKRRCVCVCVCVCVGGGGAALAGTRDYEQSDRNR